MTKKKYKPGKEIKTIQDFVSALERDNFIYIRGKIYHSGWIQSFTLRYVIGCINAGVCRKAVRIPKTPKYKQGGTK